MIFGLDLSSPLFWSAFGSILLANIVLSGDNAVVIAMAARTLKPEQRGKAIFWGSAAAIVMRIVLTIVAIQLLSLPYLKIIGAILLVYIGVDLLKGEDEGDGEGKEISGMMAAIRTILIADLVMSLDNVIGVALASKIDGVMNYPLLVIGLAISIPIVVFGSQVMIKLMERFPVIIVLGAGLIGWVAGDAIAHDPALDSVFGNNKVLAYALKVGCALFVIAVGKWLSSRAHAAKSA